MKWTLTILALAALLPSGWGQNETNLPPANEVVGRSGAERTVTPVNQITTPAGQQLNLPGLRPQAVALSPDGALLAHDVSTNVGLLQTVLPGLTTSTIQAGAAIEAAGLK